MRKNYLKPLCMVVPVRGSQLLQISVPYDPNKTTDTQLSRENDYVDYPRSSSVWDD